jgi:hypothetical protein
MCLTVKWEPSWIGLQPQQQQYAVVILSEGTQHARQLPNQKLGC